MSEVKSKYQPSDQISYLEDRIKESEIRFRSITEFSPTGIIIVDSSYKIIFANQRMLKITGYMIEEFVNSDYRQYLDTESREVVASRYIQRQKKGARPDSYEANLITKSGRIKRIQINVTTFSNNENEIFTVAHILDVTRTWESNLVQTAIFKISEAASTSADLYTLFESIHKIMGMILDVTNFYIAIYNSDEQVLSFPYHVDQVDDYPESQKAGRGLSEYIIKTGQPLYVTEKGIYDLAAAGDIDLMGTPSKVWMGSPLKTASGVMGVVVVQSYTNPDLYATNDLDILNFVSEQIATSIRNKQAEEALVKEKTYFENLFQNSPEAIILADNRSYIRRINSEFTRLFGFTEEEAVGRNIDELVAGGEFGPEAAEITARVAQGELISKEAIRFKKDGTPVYVSILGSPVITASGQEAVYAIYRDISVRKEQEDQLRLSEEKYRLLVETVNDAIVISQDGKFIFFNPQFAKMLGYARDEFRDLDYTNVHTPKGLEILEERSNIRATGREAPSRYETYFRRKDGTVITIEADVVIIDYQGKPATFAVLSDITERKQAEEQLIASEKKYRELSEELTEANNLKDLLLDVITHDLKNPAGVISGITDLLISEGQSTDEIQLIKDSCNNLQKVINNATTLAKITIGDDITREDLHLNTILRMLCAEFEPLFERVGIQIETKLKSGLHIMANPIIEEVFRNYISNAIKYAAKGKKLMIDSISARDMVTIRVTDFGKTIAPELRENIFKRGVQVDKSARKGRGLGLAIVERIARLHNGKVWVEPNQPQGNIFCLQLPRLVKTN